MKKIKEGSLLYKWRTVLYECDSDLNIIYDENGNPKDKISDSLESNKAILLEPQEVWNINGDE